MQEDYCELIETGKDENIPDNPNIGLDENNQCPCWEIAVDWCKHHTVWYNYECPECLEEQYQQEKEIDEIARNRH